MNNLIQGIINKAKTPSVNFDVTFVTPEMAEVYLQCNLNNRPLSRAHITNLAEALKRGEWKMTAEPIKFTNDDLLIDGQHRLHAILEANKGALLSIARNVPADSFDAMDRGRLRSSGDVLAMMNVKYYTAVASGLRLYCQFEQKNTDGTINLSRVISSQQIENQMKKSPSVHEWAKFSYTGIKKMLNSGTVVGLGLLFEEKDPQFAKAFFDKLSSGEGLRKGDPLLTLRDRLMLNRYSNAKLAQRHIIMIVIKCWNASRRNKSLSVLRMGDDEKIQEII